MADVSSAAQWIGRLLLEEAKYLAKVGEKVRELQDELEWMQCFLRDADATQLENSMARKWVAQIREFAYEAEDTIEKFLVKNRGGGHDFLNKVKKYSRTFWQFIELHKIGNDIDALKNKMSLLTSKLHTYGIKLRFDDSASWISNSKHKTYLTFKEEKLIVRQHDVDQLLTLILGKEEARVFSICGVSGIGKTFVADVIFKNPEIRGNFEAFAWASISQPCQISAVQQQLLSCLTSKSREQIAQMTDDELKDELRKVQRRKKCFIVLDGVGKKEVWNSLKDAFPLAAHELKSKILVTTQLTDVEKCIHQEVVIHELKHLELEQSRELLKEKVKGVPCDILSDDDKAKWVENFKDRMLGHCRGLPMAIAVLGGVLAAKRTLKEWESVDKKISTFSIDQEEQPGEKILELSYYELPYQLKPCFLYLGYFPTNMEIITTKLCRLWEAEGLVSTGENEDSEETLEEVAEKFLAELVERSMVEVGSRDLLGRVRTCRLHNVMQKLCMDKALKVNWLSVFQLGEESDQSSSTSKSGRLSKSATQKKSRRLAIYCSEKLDKLPSDYRQAKYIRSLLFFNTLEREDLLIPLKKMAVKSTFNRYKLLRVLDMENIGLSSLPTDVGNLIHLRYLSLRGSWVSKLPYTIKYLSCLQTLDLRVLSFVCVRIPDVLWRLERLVHLYLPSKTFDLQGKTSNHLQLKGLINLETLSNFSNQCRADDVGMLTNLREFSSCDYLYDNKSIHPLLGSPTSALGHLDYISLRLTGKYLGENPHALLSCKALRKLWVKGMVSTPISSCKFPDYKLNQLSLSGCKFHDDPMPVLETLCQLKKLSLEHAAFEGMQMTCSGKGFQELHCLNLRGLENLKEWRIEEGAMKKLFSLEISKCQKLEMIPPGLQFVKSLKELKISYMPLSFFKDWTPDKSRREWCDFKKVMLVPFISISQVMDYPQIIID